MYTYIYIYKCVSVVIEKESKKREREKINEYIDLYQNYRGSYIHTLIIYNIIYYECLEIIINIITTTSRIRFVLIGYLQCSCCPIKYISWTSPDDRMGKET